MNESTSPSAGPWYQNLFDTIARAGTVYLSIEQQKQLNAINIQRANSGLDPIDASQYQAGVNVGVSSSTQNTVLIVVGVLGAAWILSSFVGRSRR
jgi:hypothetical protein